MEDRRTASAAPDSVVTGEENAGGARVGHWRAGQHGGDDVEEGEHPVGAEWIGAGQCELMEEPPAEGWWKWRGDR